MCGGDAVPGPGGVSRRGLLGGIAVSAGGILLARAGMWPAAAATTVDLGGVDVIPRAEWGGDLAPAGPIPAEPDVRYLLVHHSVDPGNDYAAGDVAGILRGFVRFHTSPGKGWPDLAYNFLVDRFGRVWEGRTGSLAGPVAGDATGGNQGFDQLCCFIGNHQVAEPTPEAFDAMGRLLRAVAARSGVPLGEGATATFTSRGSNRHPAGATVTAPTIAGHRDMSRTQCPGDRVAARFGELRLLAAGGAAPAAVSTSPSPSSTAAPPGTAAPVATTAPATTTGEPATTAPAASPAAATTTATTATTDEAGGGAGWARPVALTAGSVAAVVAAAGIVRATRPRSTTSGPSADSSGGPAPE